MAAAFAADRRAAVRVLHARHPRARRVAAREEGRRSRPRHRGPPPRRPPVPVHRLREDPRRGRAARQGRVAVSRSPLGGIGTSGTRYQGLDLALGDKPYVDDLRVARHAPRRAAPRRPRPRRRRARSTRPRRPRSPGVVARVHRGRRPRRAAVGLIHKDWPVFIPDGGRTSYLGDVLAIVVADDRATARRAAELVEVEYRAAAHRSPIPSPRSTDRRGRGVGARRQRAVALGVRARRRRRRARRERARRARGVPDPAHRARVPRARVDARRARSPTAGFTCTPAARACGTTATRSRRSSASTPQRITVELVSNGGAFGGKEDMANQAQTALAAWLLGRAGEVHAVARGVAAASTRSATRSASTSTVGCDADGKLTALRAAHGRRLGSVRVGRDEGARTRRRSRQRAVPTARRSTWRRSRPAPTTRCAARSAASAPTRPSSPWRACSTGSPTRSASAAGRSAAAT